MTFRKEPREAPEGELPGRKNLPMYSLQRLFGRSLRFPFSSKVNPEIHAEPAYSFFSAQ